MTEHKIHRYQRITLAMTGASGAQYGLRLLQSLVQADREIYFVISDPGLIVVNMETDLKLPKAVREMEKRLQAFAGAKEGQIKVFGQDQWTAPIASGSAAADAMVVCPCTTGALSSIAVGASRNLLERAADVTIKEQKKLILVPRETPLSAIHLEHMLNLARLGVVILPPNPGFYQEPTTLLDLVDFVVARILDQLEIDHKLMKRWGEQ